MARLVMALALVVLAGSGAWAETPTEALQELFAQADRILTDPETEERPLDRLLAIRKLVNDAFDFRSAAELASGEHWHARTAAEQEEFTWLFTDLLQRAIVGHMAAKANLAGGTRIKYLLEDVHGDTAHVLTAMGRRDGRDLLLGYRLIDRDGVWKIRDVTMDGVSIMANYRAQLDRVLGAASFPDLLTQMRAMVGKSEATAVAESGDASPPAEPASVAAEGVAMEPVHIVDLPAPAPGLRLAAVALTLTPPAAPLSPPPAALEAPTTAPPPRTRTTKAYWLQIMVAATTEEAGRVARRLRDDKLNVGLEGTNVGGKPVVLIRVGPFKDAEEAILKLLDLQAKGHDPYLVAERE